MSSSRTGVFSLGVAFCVFLCQSNFVDGSSLIRVSRQSQYTNKYDNFDVDKLLTSKRLLVSYVQCLLDKGPCTAEGKELKKYVPDALATECMKCSEIQKKQVGKVFTNLLLHHRDLWDQLLVKYDPDEVFRTKYEIDEDYDYSNLDAA